MKMNSRGDCRCRLAKIIRTIRYSLCLCVCVCEMKLKWWNCVPSIDFMSDFLFFVMGFDSLTFWHASWHPFAVTLSNILHELWFSFSHSHTLFPPSLSLVYYSLFMCGFSHLFLFVKSFMSFVQCIQCAQSFLSGISFVFIFANFFRLRKQQQLQKNQSNFCSYFARK